MKIARLILLLAAFGLIALGALLFLVHLHALGDARMMADAVTAEVDGHSSEIPSLLGMMSTNDTSIIEDAIYAALQRPPSTSLITRADIRVTRTGDGLLECVIDTSRYGVPSRSFRQPRQPSSFSPNKLQPLEQSGRLRIAFQQQHQRDVAPCGGRVCEIPMSFIGSCFVTNEHLSVTGFSRPGDSFSHQ